MELNLKWEQHPGNPLLSPVWPEWLLGDPVVIPDADSPDGKWHMLLNSVLWIQHCTSADGVRWGRREKVCRGMRSFILREGGLFHLFYERPVSMRRSRMFARTSPDLKKWSGRKEVLRPEFEWEKERGSVVSCPCVVKDGGAYRMYYSAGQVFLDDMGFGEPKYIGVAESENVLGPYRKRPEPLMGPDPGDPYRNRGAGAMKVYRDDENNRWVGFNNGIYSDAGGRSRSAILVLTSGDGINWKRESPGPAIEPDAGWRKGHVYQMCAVPRPGGGLWMYYNARDGWRHAREHIGLEIGTPANAR